MLFESEDDSEPVHTICMLSVDKPHHANKHITVLESNINVISEQNKANIIFNWQD